MTYDFTSKIKVGSGNCWKFTGFLEKWSESCWDVSENCWKRELIGPKATKTAKISRSLKFDTSAIQTQYK